MVVKQEDADFHNGMWQFAVHDGKHQPATQQHARPCGIMCACNASQRGRSAVESWHLFLSQSFFLAERYASTTSHVSGQLMPAQQSLPYPDFCSFPGLFWIGVYPRNSIDSSIGLKPHHMPPEALHKAEWSRSLMQMEACNQRGRICRYLRAGCFIGLSSRGYSSRQILVILGSWFSWCRHFMLESLMVRDTALSCFRDSAAMWQTLPESLWPRRFSSVRFDAHARVEYGTSRSPIAR